jgi:hypothetical protein
MRKDLTDRIKDVKLLIAGHRKKIGTLERILRRLEAVQNEKPVQ